MTLRSPMLAVLLALLLTEAVTAMGRPPPSPAPAAAPPAAAPAAGFDCTLVARSEGRSTRLEARLEAREALEVRYALTVRGPGVSVSQSGEAPVAAGATEVLGDATVTGRLSDLDARLEVTVDGRATTCPIRGS